LTACRWPRPETLFAPAAQRSDELGERLPRALAARASHARGDYNAVAPRLRAELVKDRISRAADKLGALWKMAELVHPERPLSKGFARVTDRAGKTLTRAADALAEHLLTLHFADGQVEAVAGEAGTAPPPKRVEPARRRTYLPPQPGLFDEPQQ
jgi:exodeoxyribonuclease VII large subunit